MAVVDANMAWHGMSAFIKGISTVEDTIKALDTNKNGKVDRSEIETFARSQGLSAQDVMGDFQQLDLNGDGELDSSEIAHALNDSDTQQAETPEIVNPSIALPASTLHGQSPAA